MVFYIPADLPRAGTVSEALVQQCVGASVFFCRATSPLSSALRYEYRTGAAYPHEKPIRLLALRMYELHHGDCLEVMKGIPDGSVDMILCDLPYGTTACKWDTVIPFEPLWAQYRRIAKKNAAIVLTASQPFTSAVVMSNLEMFRYSWVWEKEQGVNFLTAKKNPMKVHEDVLVFYSIAKDCRIRYSPQMTSGKPYVSGLGSSGDVTGNVVKTRTENEGTRYPRSIQKFKRETGMHPTQKPVALMEYMIRTYTQEGETVLDNCMGSGTTGVACLNTGRRFIGIEREAQYFEIARARIEQAIPRKPPSGPSPCVSTWA